MDFQGWPCMGGDRFPNPAKPTFSRKLSRSRGGHAPCRLHVNGLDKWTKAWVSPCTTCTCIHVDVGEPVWVVKHTAPLYVDLSCRITCRKCTVFANSCPRGLVGLRDVELKAYSLRRQIGIRPELSKRIAIEMFRNSSTQFWICGMNSNSSPVWTCPLLTFLVTCGSQPKKDHCCELFGCQIMVQLGILCLCREKESVSGKSERVLQFMAGSCGFHSLYVF